MENLVEKLVKAAGELDEAGLHKEAVSIDSVAKTISKLSLIEHKRKIEKDMTVRWAEYQRLAHTLREIENRMKEDGNV